MKKDFAYVEFNFSKDTKEQLSKICTDIVSEDRLYTSDVVPRINGNVTEKAHCTLFYGIEPDEMNNEELKDFVKNINIKELTLGDLELFMGFQGMYKVLTIQVLDQDILLRSTMNKLLDFDHDVRMARREFRPHITIAYVDKDFQLPENYELPIETIKVESVDLSL